MNLTNLGGYPVEISGLSSGDVLYFDGTKWLNISRNASTTYFDLASPGEESTATVFNGYPVMIGNLQPNEILILRRFYNKTRDNLFLIQWFWTNTPRPNVGVKKYKPTYRYKNETSEPNNYTPAHAVTNYGLQIL